MSETYNPQERTFIKKPEMKVCVTCGQPIHDAPKPMNNHMSRYVNPISGNVVVLNDNAPEKEVQGVKMVREDVWKEQQAAKAAAPSAPVVNKPSTPEVKK